MQTASRFSERDGAEYALCSYLALIAGRAPAAHFLEIRFRVREQQLASEFRSAHEHVAVIDAIRRRGSRTDVYLGCAPRYTRSGTMDAVAQVWTLWAECDGEDAARRLRRFRPQPALVIASGSGSNRHAYWPLVAPLSPRRAEAANLRLVHTLRADPNCFDASRILRPPGTWNYKHQPPRPVGVLRLHAELRFSVDEVVAHLPAIGEEILERRWDASAREVHDDPLLAIPPRTYVADLLGRRPGRDGKVQCPFHDDEHASLHAYPTGQRGWFCFSCRRGGTIYDLAAAVWGLQTRRRDFVELRTRLLDRYQRELSAPRGPARSREINSAGRLSRGCRLSQLKARQPRRSGQRLVDLARPDETQLRHDPRNDEDRSMVSETWTSANATLSSSLSFRALRIARMPVESMNATSRRSRTMRRNPACSNSVSSASSMPAVAMSISPVTITRTVWRCGSISIANFGTSNCPDAAAADSQLPVTFGDWAAAFKDFGADGEVSPEGVVSFGVAGAANRKDALASEVKGEGAPRAPVRRARAPAGLRGRSR
jgi:hypothetical protein